MGWAIRINEPFGHKRVNPFSPITFTFNYIEDGVPATPVTMVFIYREAISSGVWGTETTITFPSGQTSLTLPANTWQSDKIYQVRVRPQEDGVAGGTERIFSTEYIAVKENITASPYVIPDLSPGTWKAVVRTTAGPGVYSYPSNEVTFVRTQDIWTKGQEVTSSVQQGQIVGLADGDYEVQVRTADAEGFGPWSAAVAFMVNSPPVVTNFSMTNVPQGNASIGTWTYTDAEGNPQTKYRMRWRRVSE